MTKFYRTLRRLYWAFRYVHGRGRGTSILRRQLSHLKTVERHGPTVIQDSIWGMLTIEMPAGYVMTSERGECRRGLLTLGWLVRTNRDSPLYLTEQGCTVLRRHHAINALFRAHYRGHHG